MQLFAGYILSSIKSYLSNQAENEFLRDILSKLCCFEIDANFEWKRIHNQDPLASVLSNIISRGLPTLTSTSVEDYFTDKFNIADKKVLDKIGAIQYEYRDTLSNYGDLLIDSLAIIDPRIKPNSEVFCNLNSWENHPASDYEIEFYVNILPKIFGDYIFQLLEPQRTIETILKYSIREKQALQSLLRDMIDSFYNQRIDFTIEFPITNQCASGIAIEIDGHQHEEPNQKILDKRRDERIKSKNWSDTIRINTDELFNIPEEKLNSLSDFLNHPYAKMCNRNYEIPLWEREGGLDAVQLVLSPFGIARVQKILSYLILSDLLSIDDSVWNIAILERDVPCGELAVRDFMEALSRLLLLEGKDRKEPRLNLKIYNTAEFARSILYESDDIELIDEPLDYFEADVVIDVSILQRDGFSDFPVLLTEKLKFSKYVSIRSAHSIKDHRRVISAQPVKYKVPFDSQPKALVYFLQNIFRKQEYLSGQVDILRKTLNHENVIALLPTGAGKSLTYQLSAMLQPGIVLIIDPLKSLMRDQNDNLIQSGIDCSVFINSSLSAAERIINSDKMNEGYFQFIFISPERLQIEEFRKYLRNDSDSYFTYCIVDEAHCVSEWGHDFRTSYLRLGYNARKYCRTFLPILPIVALTGTASFSVLADVQRELNITDESAIVSPLNYARSELMLHPIKVENQQLVGGGNDNLIRRGVAAAKSDRLFELIEKLNELEWGTDNLYVDYEEFFQSNTDYKNTGIIFCPHVTSHFGVKNISAQLINRFPTLSEQIGYYAGSASDIDQKELDEIQDDFKKDKKWILTATKAFGMGIDKPNIRFTFHFNMPQSIESYYQEVGRAGRDRDLAHCYILYSPHSIRFNNESVSVDKYLMLSFFKNSFKGRDKEFTTLFELLTEITYESIARINTFNEKIKTEYDEILRLRIWKGDYTNNKRLYLNTTTYPQTVGYIDLNNGQIKKDNTNKNPFESETSQKLLNEINNIVFSEKPDGTTQFDWVSYREIVQSKSGIVPILNGLVENESKVIIIGFLNNTIDDIIQKLSENSDFWTPELILDAYSFTNSHEDFIVNLKEKFRQITNNNLTLSHQQIEYIQNNYASIRDTNDTFKAVYRLTILGIIEEYEIDYKDKTIIATIRKRYHSYYQDKLIEYIARYVSFEEKELIKSDILSAQDNEVIEKCCRILIDFVYNKIAARRREAINEMESAIVNGLSGGNFSEIINTYFDSKYTNELRAHIYDNNIEFVWQYMERSQGSSDELNHIRGACDRLLIENPDNPSFLLLRSFSKLLIANYSINEAVNDYKKAIEIYTKIFYWNRKEYLDNISKYISYIEKYESTKAVNISQYLLEDHLNWLIKFNNKFLSRIEND